MRQDQDLCQGTREQEQGMGQGRGSKLQPGPGIRDGSGGRSPSTELKQALGVVGSSWVKEQRMEVLGEASQGN